MKEADLNFSEHKRWYLERVSEKISHNSLNMIRVASELYERTIRYQVNPISQILDHLWSKLLLETLVALAFNFTKEDISNLFESFLDDLLTKFQDQKSPSRRREAELAQETLSKAQLASLFDIMASDD